MVLATKFDYDLNIFRKEVEAGYDVDMCLPLYEFSEEWYLHVYQVNEYQGATMHEELGDPIELTEMESNALQLGTGYFNENDCWYGRDGFVRDYGHLLSERLTNLLDLPVYQEEVLF
jgi:hypothetical protein